MKDMAERIRGASQQVGDCWVWQKSRTRDGYGQLHIEGQGTRIAHRLSYEAFVGAIPDGLEIDHLCNNRACVNPSHLEPVTHAENMRRTSKGTCANGHARNPDNTRVTTGADGAIRRACRPCQAAASRRYKARRSVEEES